MLVFTRRTYLVLGSLIVALAACQATVPAGPEAGLEAGPDAADANTVDTTLDASPDVFAPPADATCDGCSDAGPLTLAVSVRQNGAMAVSELVDLRTQGASSVTLRYVDLGVAANALVRTVPVTDAPTTVPLLGMRAGTTWELTAVASSSDGRSVSQGPLRFTTSPLPAALPAMRIFTPATNPNDVLLVSLISASFAPGGVSYAAIVDRAGHYLWYRQGGDPTVFGFDFQRWPNGHFTIFQLAQRGYEEVSLDSTLVHTWLPPAGGVLLDGHDFQLATDRTALAIVTGTHTDDTTHYVDGGVAEAQVLDMTLQRIDETGDASVLWSSWPGVTLAETAPDTLLPGAGPIDALHPNALTPLDDGNLLLSMRDTDTVYKIDPRAHTILWRLGGTRSDFTFVNDPLHGFSHQHNPHFLPNGDLLLFDNGNTHTPPVSRAAQYHLDETAHTATLVWQYHHSPEHFSMAAGSVVRFPNGNTLISWGYTGLMTEVTAAGSVVWEAQYPGFLVYRAFSADPSTL